MSRAVGRVVDVVTSPLKATWNAGVELAVGAGKGLGRVFEGAGQILKGEGIGKGLHTMFIKSSGEVLGGVLGAGKELMGNPVTAFLTGGALGGAMLAGGAGLLGLTGGTTGFLLAGAGSALFGGGASQAFGALQQGVYNWTGITEPQVQAHKCNNECKLGPKNGQVCENPGINYPPGMPPQFYPQDPNFVGPPVPPGYCPPCYGQQQRPGMDMTSMMMMMSTMAMMLPMMASMGGGGWGGSMGSGLDAYFAGGQFNANPGNFCPGHRHYIC